jgi:hypothetical protein
MSESTAQKSSSSSSVPSLSFLLPGLPIPHSEQMSIQEKRSFISQENGEEQKKHSSVLSLPRIWMVLIGISMGSFLLGMGVITFIFYFVSHSEDKKNLSNKYEILKTTQDLSPKPLFHEKKSPLSFMNKNVPYVTKNVLKKTNPIPTIAHSESEPLENPQEYTLQLGGFQREKDAIKFQTSMNSYQIATCIEPCMIQLNSTHVIKYYAVRTIVPLSKEEAQEHQKIFLRRYKLSAKLNLLEQPLPLKQE